MDLLDLIAKDEALDVPDHGLEALAEFRGVDDDEIVRVYTCRCGQSFGRDTWASHVEHMRVDDEPTDPDVIMVQLGEHGRPLFSDLAGRMGACLICGHARILHGKSARLRKTTGRNGECTHCECVTYRAHAEHGTLASERLIRSKLDR